MTQETNKKEFNVDAYFNDQEDALNEAASKGPQGGFKRVASGYTTGKILGLQLNNGDWGPSLQVKFQLHQEAGNNATLDPATFVEFINLPSKPGDYATLDEAAQAKADQQYGINFDKIKGLAIAVGVGADTKPKKDFKAKTKEETAAVWSAWKKDVVKTFLSSLAGHVGAVVYVAVKNPMKDGKYITRKNGNAIVNYSFYGTTPEKSGAPLTPETFWLTN